MHSIRVRVLASVIAALVVMVGFLPFQPAWAEDEQLQTPLAQPLLKPIEELLSGGALNRIQFFRGDDSWIRVGEQSAEPAGGARPSQPLVSIPYRSPTAKFSRNVILTYDLGAIPYQNEPTVAVNPLDPDHVVVGAHDYDTPCVVSYVSFDGGETWRGPFHADLAVEDSFCSDPVLAFDRDGNVYYAYLSIGTRPLRVGQLLLVAEVSSAVVSISRDGGITWEGPYIASTGIVEQGQNSASITFIDKIWMNVGPDPFNPERDNIYVTYTEFRLIYPFLDQYPFVAAPIIEVSIKLVVSYDGGKTWTRPVAVSPVYRYPAGELDRPIVQGSNIAVAKDGTLYIAYYDSMSDGPFKGLFSPYVTVSYDGGRSFEGPYAVVPGGTWEQDFFLKPTYFRSWSSMFPFIAVSPNNSKEVYIVFGALGEAGGDRSDVYFSKSTDGGKTWREPKRVNDDLTLRNQFFPTLTVSPNGTIHIIWGDMRDDPNNYRYHIYYTKSGDGGETFMENSRVSDYPSNPGRGIPIFIGDYFGIAATNEDVYIVWTDSRSGEVGGRNQDIAFARLRAIPKPSITLSPPEGPAGQTITIMGFNFAPRQREVFIEVDGVVISSVPTDDSGRFVAQIFMPVSGEGAHTIRAIDVLGNVATANYYSTFGFNTIEDRIDSVIKEMAGKLESIKPDNPQAANITVSKIVDEVVKRIEPLLASRQEPRDSGITPAFIISIAAMVIALAALFIATTRGRSRS